MSSTKSILLHCCAWQSAYILPIIRRWTQAKSRIHHTPGRLRVCEHVEVGGFWSFVADRRPAGPATEGWPARPGQGGPVSLFHVSRQPPFRSLWRYAVGLFVATRQGERHGQRELSFRRAEGER